MTGLLLIRVNCPSPENAESIAQVLIEGGVVACANVQGPVTAIYRWKGKLESTGEWLLWLKAPEMLWPRIEETITDLHPHEVPAILAIPCQRGHTPYVDWVFSETEVDR